MRGGKRGGAKGGARGSWKEAKQDADVLSGPGVMITCVKNKERSAIQEAERIFSEVANELYPDLGVLSDEKEAEAEEGAELDIEQELAADLEKERNYKKETPRHFLSCQTEAMCIIYVNFRPPIDPVKVVEHIFTKIEQTGVMNWNYCLRLTPMSATCAANMEDLVKLAKRLIPPHFDDEEHQEPKTFRLETKGRYNDESVSRNNVIEIIPKLVPSHRGHKVSFDKSDKVICIETYKNATGMSILDNFDRFKKYNLRETQAKYHKKASAPEKAPSAKGPQELPVTDPRSPAFAKHYAENEQVKAGADAVMIDILKGKGERTAAADDIAAEAVVSKRSPTEAALDQADDTTAHGSKKLRLI